MLGDKRIALLQEVHDIGSDAVDRQKLFACLVFPLKSDRL